ncbi:lipid-A-disaccharide synthase [Amylibacter kogurei]|uniref:Lipid-A-disaccharide synthase n=1 Tax=Paramylibacter kogurei TaxID=1889778 RepID=A0A2G5K6C9_9RHOB|nr:lipid-A-disaccharide synthase [Amylibacter kogurei]PIB24659.1 lipid-A-disaccharide synthase [Amylibacter kogurei]
MNKPLNLFILAGEASGDKLGGALMQGLNTLYDGDITYRGVGGDQMIANGLPTLFDMSDLSVMGLVEILPKIPKLLSRVKTTARAAIAQKPDAIITIDSPDFCFRVVAKVKETYPDIPVIHYVAPSVWAWRPERAQKMARYVDHVLALLPFEPPYMIDAGMTCDFVGHPAAFDPPLDAAALGAMKQQLGLEGPVITLLPGSRAGEIKRMMPIFRQVAKNISAKHPDTNFLLPVARPVVKQVQRAVANWALPVKLLLPQADASATEARKNAAYAISDVALATSGTVALELAAQNCPMVVAYRANWATTRMVKKLAQIDTANLVNIVTQSRVIPEFLFEKCTAAQLTPAIMALLDDKAALGAQENALQDTMKALGRGDPDMKLAAARSVLNKLGK